MIDPDRIARIINDLKARGVEFQPNGLNLFYDSIKDAVFCAKGQEQTDRIPLDDPRLIDKLTAQCLHLLEWFNP